MYIRSLHIKNYRSLKNVKIGGMTPFTIFYGENDSGKSNILFFLEHVFQEKYTEEVTEVAAEGEVRQKKPTGFWRGEIDHFSDNFYKNQTEPITFSIGIRFRRSEVLDMSFLPQGFLDVLIPGKKYDLLELDGQIDQIEESDRARMTLLEAKFNWKKFYDSNASDDSKYLPEFELDSGESLDAFNGLMNNLDNAFLRIGNNRFITSEKESERGEPAEFKPGSFKNWLFQASLGRKTEKLFRKICFQFDSTPFKHGRISIARIGDEIEVLVEDNFGLKLPIERKGTGVQEILIILSYIAKSNSPFIGIEELEINLSPKSQTALFNSLFDLIYKTPDSPIQQVFLTTHSPHIANRNEANRRGVRMDNNGNSILAKPSDEEVKEFFGFH